LSVKKTKNRIIPLCRPLRPPIVSVAPRSEVLIGSCLRNNIRSFLLIQDFRKNGVSRMVLFAFEWLYVEFKIHRYLIIYNIREMGFGQKPNYNPDSQLVLIPLIRLYRSYTLVLILTEGPQTMSSRRSILWWCIILHNLCTYGLRNYVSFTVKLDFRL